MNDKAIVSLVIGEETRNMFDSHFKSSWELYAAKHGYDIVLVDKPIDMTSPAWERTAHWQKCLILEHEKVRPYERVAWIDADIAINHFSAPSIIDTVEPGRIGVVGYLRGSAAVETYREAGLPDDVDVLANTGVIVLEPEKDRDLMRHVYDTCAEGPKSGKENVPLSYHLFKSSRAVELDPRFNVDWSNEIHTKFRFLYNTTHPLRDLMAAYCVHTAWYDSYFLHFINQTLDGIGEDGEIIYSHNTRQDMKLLTTEIQDPRWLVVNIRQ